MIDLADIKVIYAICEAKNNGFSVTLQPRESFNSNFMFSVSSFGVDHRVEINWREMAMFDSDDIYSRLVKNPNDR